ncbi:MAG: glycosyltransferase family 4 protein [Clostridia bacterium]|nr:glycosyltransferase family 4 protein [Clostridia bacterium]
MTGGTIICMGNFELPDLNAAAHRVVNNGKLFRRLGFETVFLGVSRKEGGFSGTVRREYGFGFDMYEQAYPATTRQWVKQIFDVGSLCRLADRYPDTVAVLLYNTQYATLLAARRAFHKRGIRVLYDCTEWNGYTEGNALKRAVKALDSRLIENRLPESCDGLIAVSTAMEKRYGERTPLLLLPPLVDTSAAVWRQPPRHNDTFTFCYAGEPSDKDRLDLLLQAFARLPAGKAALRIIGMTAEAYAAGRPDAPDGVPAGVEFVGRLGHDETVREILGCGCFVFLREPSRRNTAGFPTKFVEACTCGVPVITTAVSDIERYADERCLIVPEITVDGIVCAMLDVLARPSRPRTLRDTFDYARYTDGCRRWLERIPCRKE